MIATRVARLYLTLLVQARTGSTSGLSHALGSGSTTSWGYAHGYGFGQYIKINEGDGWSMHNPDMSFNSENTELITWQHTLEFPKASSAR